MKVGVTGHQFIGSTETTEWVKISLEKLVSEYKIELGLTTLARGADQLFAQVLRIHHIPYIAIIPSKDYRETFEDSLALDNYDQLLEAASEIQVLDMEEASEQAYYDAGKFLVDNSELMIAVWDGKPAKGLGGTGDVVKYAAEMNKRLIHVDTILRKVSILVPKSDV